MSDDINYDEILKRALKRMQENVKTAVSSSYNVHRSHGEVVVRRSDKDVPIATDVDKKKTGTG